jgi:hypothetical protein
MNGTEQRAFDDKYFESLLCEERYMFLSTCRASFVNENVIQQLKCFKQKQQSIVCGLCMLTLVFFSSFYTTTTRQSPTNGLCIKIIRKTSIHKRKAAESWMKIWALSEVGEYDIEVFPPAKLLLLLPFSFRVAFRWVAETFCCPSSRSLACSPAHWLREYFISSPWRRMNFASCANLLSSNQPFLFLTSPATCFLARARRDTSTFWYNGHLARNNNFYKRKLVFQSILFYISLSSPSSQVFFIWINQRCAFVLVIFESYSEAKSRPESDFWFSRATRLITSRHDFNLIAFDQHNDTHSYCTTETSERPNDRIFSPRPAKK